jgi:hypothetical protein
MAGIPPFPSQSEDVPNRSDEKNIKISEIEQVEGTVRLIDENGRIRKIPVPSNDPTDPLTWGSWRRSLILISICLFGTAGFGVVQSTPLFFGDIISEYEEQTRGVGSL